jgi:hypothetical protein
MRRKMKKITLLLVVVLVGLMVAPVFAEGNPVVYPNWQSGDAEFECAQIGFDFTEEEGKILPEAFKFDNWDSLVTGSAVKGIFITENDGSTFNWYSTHGIGAVIVKAGTGANVWFYDPQAYSDTGLFGYAGKEISHVTFCWNPEPADPQWCSPGYWRQPQHADSWLATGYSPDDLFSTVFGYAPMLSKLGKTNGATANPTLLQVLSAPQYYGGEAFNLIGDLLSGAHPDVNYMGERVEDSCPLN